MLSLLAAVPMLADLSDRHHLIGAFVVLIALLVCLGIVGVIIFSAPASVIDPWKPTIRWLLIVAGGLLIIGFIMECVGWGPSTW
jgi:threonine/homoserine/homoserine lactone efflux protein